MKKGQEDESLIYHNCFPLTQLTLGDGSPAYEEFLSIMGDVVEIESWKGFTGGLNHLSGTYSLYTEFKRREIMYHVATMLNEDEEDEQCVCLKII